MSTSVLKVASKIMSTSKKTGENESHKERGCFSFNFLLGGVGMGNHDEACISNHPSTEAAKLKITAIFKVAKRTADNRHMSHFQAQKKGWSIGPTLFIAF